MADGLTVRHYNREGRAKGYNFAALPVAEPLQQSLATLFAARCVPHRWSAHTSSTTQFGYVERFAKFLAQLDEPPQDLGGLTVAMVTRWRLVGGYHSARVVFSLLQEDARLQVGPVAEEMARRFRTPKSQVQSYSEAEFEQITNAARRTFRAALLRIERNALHLQRWRSRDFTEGCRDWVIGEALDVLARCGELPRVARSNGYPELMWRYRRALGGTSAAATWQRLFLSCTEAAALGVLLMAEYGWNLSVIDRLAVPGASPDPGRDGCPTYRIPLEKRRRGGGHSYETRNVTDDGADSRGRLITQALAATRFARAVVDELSPGTDRLIVWRTNAYGRKPIAQDRHSAIGPFCFGVRSTDGTRWAQSEGFAGSPFRRGRRTVVALDRREPQQHSQDTHDRQYVLVDKRVQQNAVEVIAAGAEDAAERARTATLVAELRDAPTAGDVETATADCSDMRTGPIRTPDGGCGASFLHCLACPNARIHPGHHPRLVHLHQAVSNLRSVISSASWDADWGDTHARLDDLKTRLGEGLWAQAHDQVCDADRRLIHQLLTGVLDT